MKNYPQSADLKVNIAILILAAGGSRRLGTPKQLLKVTGQSLLFQTTQAALGSRCRPVVVVLGAEANLCRAELINLPVEVVMNERWAEGISTSIGAGIGFLQNLDPVPEAVVIVLCDQPFLTTDLIDALVEKHQSSGCKAIASQYGEVTGVPALFAVDYFEALKALTGDQGARKLLQTGQIAFLPFPRGAVDIDTVSDYENLLGGLD
ncbi:MAG: 4-diphosphocytidyl-2C-methyl-D-erythritol synthase [Chthoniobacteraceae bacterium]|nr:4-diphosphocytidyl-2C-methyl-D-erythritol synthase [Chthoniobacteraceae bacterium]